LNQNHATISTHHSRFQIAASAGIASVDEF